MSRISWRLCGVPEADCSGMTIAVNEKWTGSKKAHRTPEEAFNCMARHLVRNGYIRRGPREFQHKDGGPVTVLTKKSRYGGELRTGKAGRAMRGQRTSGSVY